MARYGRRIRPRPTLLKQLAPAASYTLTAGTGHFVLTGQPVNLKAGIVLTTATGSFALTGQPVNLVVAAVLSAAPGVFTLTGQDVTLRVGAVLTVDVGVYTLTGFDVTLIYNPPGSYTLVAGTGHFTLTGFDADLISTPAPPAPVPAPVPAKGLTSLEGAKGGYLIPPATPVLAAWRPPTEPPTWATNRWPPFFAGDHAKPEQTPRRRKKPKIKPGHVLALLAALDDEET